MWRCVTEAESAHLYTSMADAGVDGFTSDLPQAMVEWRDARDAGEAGAKNVPGTRSSREAGVAEAGRRSSEASAENEAPTDPSRL